MADNNADCVIHSSEEICGIRKAASIAASVREKLRQIIQPGMSTLQIDQHANLLIREAGAVSAFHGYKGFPSYICISLNDEVVHGTASPDKKVKEGDLVSLDIGVNYQGFIGDTAVSFYLSSKPAPKEVRYLLEKTHLALMRAIEAAKEGNRVRHISEAIERTAREAKLGVVREFVGHGVGCQLHEPPEIPNFVSNNPGPELKNGMVLAIEPMLNLGGSKIKIDKDNWTVRTADAKLSAHFEHMILINGDKPEVLTWPKMM